MDIISETLYDIGIQIYEPWVFIPQLLTVIPLWIYLYKSISVISKEIKSEHNQQGAVPILAFVYMLFSCYYVIHFILNFGAIISGAEFHLRNANPQGENIQRNILFMKLLTVGALLAFTTNFFKSFYTLNSLEFGKLSQHTLKKIFNSDNTKAWVEGIFRLIIATLFIRLEKALANSDTSSINAPKVGDVQYFQEPTFLSDLGWIALPLYIFMGIWLLILNLYLDKTNSSKIMPNYWYKWSGWQFCSGLIISGVFIYLGSLSSISPRDMNDILLLILGVGIFFSLALIFSVFRNEYLSTNVTA